MENLKISTWCKKKKKHAVMRLLLLSDNYEGYFLHSYLQETKGNFPPFLWVIYAMQQS